MALPTVVAVVLAAALVPLAQGGATGTASGLTFDVAAAKNRPVSKVITLLKDMLKQLEKEAETDEEIYDKMACWCETNDREKTKAIKDAEARITDLTTKIEEYTALSARLSTEIKNLEKEVAENQEALDQATAIRQKQLAEFNAEEKDLLESISALKAAVTVLSKHHGGSLVQIPRSHMLSVAATLQHEMQKHATLLAGVFTHTQRKVVDAFVQAPEANDTGDAPPADEGSVCGDSTKLCCEKYLYWVSFLMFVLGIVMGAYGYVSINGADFKPTIGEYSVKWDVPSNIAIAYALIAGAIFTVVVAVFGFLTSYCKNPCFALPLAILALVSGLIAIIGGVFVFSGGASSYVQNQVCGDALGGANFIKNQYTPFVDSKMCVAGTCECSAQPANTTALFAAAASRVGRTAALNWGGSMTSYRACYDSLKAGATGQASDNSTVQFFKKGGFQFLESFEKQYTCAGLCYTPLFYLTRPLSAGPPTQSCDAAFIASVTGNTGVGAVSLLTGVILITMFLGSLTLCGGLAKDSDVMGGA